MLTNNNLKLLLSVFIFYQASCALDNLTIGDFFDHSSRNLTWPMVERFLKTSVDGIVGKNLLSLARFPAKANVSHDCQAALASFVFAIRKSKKWAVQMVDATAKIPSGILDGTVMDFGSYDECLSIRVNSSHDQEIFRGQYCMVGLASPLISPITDENILDYLKKYGKPPEWILENMKKGKGFMKDMAFWFGICVPSSCTRRDVVKVARTVSEPLGFVSNVVDCQIEEHHRIWKGHEIAAVSILSFLAACTFLGTLVDVINRLIRGSMESRKGVYSNDGRFIKFCKSFSLYANTEKMLQTSSGPLSLFHGIRFYSATWIILGHTYFFVNTWKFLKHRHLLGMAEQFDDHILTAVIDNFTIPVGSFFFMSGVLITYINFPKLEKNAGRLNVLLFLFHKFWRMIPALSITIVLLMGMPLIDSGPLWYSTINPHIELCQKHWWKNILFINNWWNVENFCLIHSWYLSALMQFHIVALILLLIIYRSAVLGVILALLLIAGCCAVTALHVVWEDFPMPAPGRIRDTDIMRDYISAIHIKSYAHVATYLIGMVTGHAVLKYRNADLTMGHHLIGWLIAICCGVSSVYGIYGPADSVHVRAVYISLHRIGWAVALAWVTYACACGKAGPVNRLLSWKALQPLGHLSFLAYLLHPLVIIYRDASAKERVYLGHTELVFAFLANVVVSYFLAYICYILLELPCSHLEGMVLSRTRRASLRNGYSNNKDSSNVATIAATNYKEHA